MCSMSLPPTASETEPLTVFSAAPLLFLVMNPFGNILSFLSIPVPCNAARQPRIIARELLIALAVLMTFAKPGYAESDGSWC